MASLSSRRHPLSGVWTYAPGSSTLNAVGNSPQGGSTSHPTTVLPVRVIRRPIGQAKISAPSASIVQLPEQQRCAHGSSRGPSLSASGGRGHFARHLAADPRPTFGSYVTWPRRGRHPFSNRSVSVDDVSAPEGNEARRLARRASGWSRTTRPHDDTLLFNPDWRTPWHRAQKSP